MSEHSFRPHPELPPRRLWGQLRWVVLVLSMFFLAVDWLALNDITTGREPSLAAEWSFLGLSAIWFLGVALTLVLGTARETEP